MKLEGLLVTAHQVGLAHDVRRTLESVTWSLARMMQYVSTSSKTISVCAPREQMANDVKLPPTDV